MVQLAVWIGAAGANAVDVAAGGLVGWMLSVGEEIAGKDNVAVADDVPLLLTQLGTSVG